MPIGLEDRLVNNASGFSIAGAIDNDIRGIYWVANTGTRDTLGDANSNNSDLRAQYVICVVGSTPYIYTSSSIADPDWTNTANWQEFALGDLSQVISDVSANTAAIGNNTTAIALNTAKVSADGSIDTHSDVDTSTTAPETGQVLFWNGTNWVPEHPEVTVEVKNDTLTNFTKGTPVYVNGTHASGKPTIDLADNDGTGTYPAIGLLYDDIDAGAEGLVVISGSIFGLNTTGYSAGDALYLDSTPGILTNTRPAGHTKAVQKVALVKRSHASAGSVIVMGAGRTNDVPNIQQNYFWRGDASGVATPTDFESAVHSTTNVTNNTTKLAGIDAGATANPNAIDNVVEDTTPQLGGGLDLNGQNITGTGNIDITGKVTQTGTPTANQDLATKVYVDELIAAGIHYHDPVRVESPDGEGSLNGTYNNGTAGVGATLTNAGTQAALVIDGVTLAVSDRVLIYNQTDATENGIYTVTNTGSPTTNWVLTRATDADSYGLGNTELSEGTSVFVLEGDDGAGEVYACTTTGTITFGTTDINFSQIGASPVYGNATTTEDGFMSSADKTKLDGIDAGATANQTDAYLLDRANHTGTQTAATISNFDAAVSANSDVSANVTKLAGIEAGATADQTAGEIKTAYESNLNTNAFTDADVTKLNGIAAGAEVNVNADWSATSGDAEILNKPTLGTAAAANVSDFIEDDSSIAAQPIRQYYANTAAFPSAATWHGAIAHSHADGAMYFAHGGSWIKLGNDSDIFDGDYNSLTNKPTVPVVGVDAQAHDSNLTTFVNAFTLPTVDGSSGHVLTTNGSGTLSFAAAGGSGSSTLLGLTDTPAAFGSTGQVLAVNSAGNAVEFVNQSGGSGAQRTLTVPSGNGYSGDVVTFGSQPGGGFTVGKLYYFSTSGSWEEAYGTGVSTSTGMLGICVNSTTPEILVRGIIKSTSYANQYSIGRRLYVSTLQGGSGRFMDAVPPSPPTGSVIRAAGYVVDAVNGALMFDPSQDYITVS